MIRTVIRSSKDWLPLRYNSKFTELCESCNKQIGKFCYYDSDGYESDPDCLTCMIKFESKDESGMPPRLAQSRLKQIKKFISKYPEIGLES